MNTMMGSSSSMGIPSLGSLFSYYASLTAIFTLLQQAYLQTVPQQIRDVIARKLEQWFTKTRPNPCQFTLIIDQKNTKYEYFTNEVYTACEIYLSDKLTESSTCLKVNREHDKSLNFRLTQGHQYKEVYEGVEFDWTYVLESKSSRDDDHSRRGEEKEYIKLSVELEHKSMLLNSYLPYVLRWYDELMEKAKELWLYTLGTRGNNWQSVQFNHPFTFDSLAIDPQLKKTITEDLDRFVRRKEFYKRVGKAWKRGYLLYGPPGTGKSSLIAVMANYLKFDIFDLQLGQVQKDSTLRELMLSTTNKSILVIEDIDCSLGLPKCREPITDDDDDDDYNYETEAAQGKTIDANQANTSTAISLSGLLNFIDGLWSSCGDERIIIFTTNHKAKLDPALLRPGRMDMHIHMSYLTMPGLRVLAANYLDLAEDDQRPLLKQIESLIQEVDVTAAQVAEEMMRSEDADTALGGVVQLLLKNKSEQK